MCIRDRVYDSSTIIITGDHGKSEDVHSLDTYKTTALFVKPLSLIHI